MTINWLGPTFGTTLSERTITNKRNGRRLLINTVRPLSDGRTLPRREKEYARRTVLCGAPGDIVAIIPLPADGGKIDEERLEAALVPLFEELANPPPRDDPRDSAPLDQLWHLCG